MLDKVQEFEKYLDNEMKKLGIMRYNRFESIEAVESYMRWQYIWDIGNGKERLMSSSLNC